MRRRLVVHGLVQGVWFRDSARRESERRGVAGTATNEPDGTVEVVLEGPAEAVAAVEAWCAVGPLQARVEHVDGRDEPPVGLVGFQVG